MKKRFKFLTVILVVALMLSLTATATATSEAENNGILSGYGYHEIANTFWVSYSPGIQGFSNATAYTTVNVKNASDGLAITTITGVNGSKSTSRGTTVTGDWVNSGLAGASGSHLASAIYHLGQRLYNGTLYTWDVSCP